MAENLIKGYRYRLTTQVEGINVTWNARYNGRESGWLVFEVKEGFEKLLRQKSIINIFKL